MAYPTNVEQLFIEHAGLLRNDVAKSIVSADFFVKNITKEPWVDGQGQSYSYPIFERSLPTTPVTFVSWTSSPGSGDVAQAPGDGSVVGGSAATPSGQNIDSFGVTTRQVSLVKASLNSPDIALEDLRFTWQVEDQVKNVTRVLAENTKKVWADAYLSEYVAATGSKQIAAAGIPEGTTSFPLTAPTSKLTWGLLEEVYERLGYVGGDINPFSRIDDAPIYAAVGDRFTFQDLKRVDSNARDDFHYAFEGSEGGSPMLGTPGLGGIYRGFKFFTIQNPPRYDFVNGAWVKREPYTPSSATRGEKWEIAQTYKDAAYTDTIIFHQDVLKILTPKPIGVKGGMSMSNPTYDWAGTFVWRNLSSRDSNIDGNIGFFRALYAYGAKVERPDLGFVIRHKRCQRALDLTACY